MYTKDDIITSPSDSRLSSIEWNAQCYYGALDSVVDNANSPRVTPSVFNVELQKEYGSTSSYPFAVGVADYGLIKVTPAIILRDISKEKATYSLNNVITKPSLLPKNPENYFYYYGTCPIDVLNKANTESRLSMATFNRFKDVSRDPLAYLVKNLFIVNDYQTGEEIEVDCLIKVKRSKIAMQENWKLG